MNPFRQVLQLAGLASAALLWGCSSLPEPFGDDSPPPRAYPEEVVRILAEAEGAQDKGHLREAIEMVEKALIDYPSSSALQVRLGELRSMRQVCFASDWSEAGSLCEKQSPNTALVVLKRIERYGDRDMIQRAREKMDEIRARNPGI